MCIQELCLSLFFYDLPMSLLCILSFIQALIMGRGCVTQVLLAGATRKLTAFSLTMFYLLLVIIFSFLCPRSTLPNWWRQTATHHDPGSAGGFFCWRGVIFSILTQCLLKGDCWVSLCITMSKEGVNWRYINKIVVMVTIINICLMILVTTHNTSHCNRTNTFWGKVMDFVTPSNVCEPSNSASSYKYDITYCFLCHNYCGHLEVHNYNILLLVIIYFWHKQYMNRR